MSYCRFSSDDFGSDVYVYEAEDGVTIHVANNRIVLARPMPEPLDLTVTPFGSPEWIEAWVARGREVTAIVEASEHKPIGLGRDGEFYYGLSYEQAATKLTELKALGYNVPDGVIEDLLSESSEEED